VGSDGGVSGGGCNGRESRGGVGGDVVGLLSGADGLATFLLLIPLSQLEKR